MEAKLKKSRNSVLLIDVGNTHVHCGWLYKGRLTNRFTLKTLSLGRQLKLAIRNHSGKEAVIASVVPSVNPEIKAALKGFGLVYFINHKSPLGVGIDYPKPATIGADRLANAAGAVELYGAPVVVIDFGTAVTFDIVSSKRQYVGGVIAPGLAVMTDYLYQKTALLPQITLREPTHAIGKSTVEAMTIGAVHGYRGMISNLLTEVKKNVGKKAKVIITGGYGNLIAQKLKGIHEVNDDLTLIGLIQVYKRLS